MIERVVYTNEKGQSVELNHSAPLIIFDIEGIDGVTSDIKTNKSAFNDGVSISNVSIEEKILTLNCYMYINCDDKSPDLRDYYLESERDRLKKQLYKVFNPAVRGTLKIYKKTTSKSASDLVVVQAPIFEMDYTTANELCPFQIQLLMPFPYFSDEFEQKVEFGNITGLLEFPLDVPPEGIEIAQKNNEIVKNIYNAGDTAAAMKVVFKAKSEVVNPSIYNIYTKEQIKINTTMKKSETITVTTDKGNKRIISECNGVTENIFTKLDKSSTFMWLDVGDNIIRYNADELLEQLEVYITYKNYYLGV